MLIYRPIGGWSAVSHSTFASASQTQRSFARDPHLIVICFRLPRLQLADSTFNFLINLCRFTKLFYRTRQNRLSASTQSLWDKQSLAAPFAPTVCKGPAGYVKDLLLAFSVDLFCYKSTNYQLTNQFIPPALWSYFRPLGWNSRGEYFTGASH